MDDQLIDWRDIQSRMARYGEQDHGDDPISRRYCLSASMNFVKHDGQ
jgi:hypothetical protein